MTADREAAIRARVELCGEQIRESPYSHTIAAGWYAEDMPGLLAELAAARAKIEDAETDAANARSSRDELLAEAREQNEKLREALRQVRHGCLLNIRRAAFGPEIGVRYTEAIRADISNQCARLEQFIDAALSEGEG